MVLAGFGIEKSEAELRSLCECDETGTTPSNVIKAAMECGFNAYKANLIFEDLGNLISQNLNPIVYLRVSAEADYSHAVVIYKITKKKVSVLDPEIGEREIEVKTFNEIWSRVLTIVIER